MFYRILADFVTTIHFAFVLFAVLGGFLVLKWKRLAWLHGPAALWSIAMLLAGWICPLTPLENRLRAEAGLQGYEGAFIEHYILYLLYPTDLSRDVQIGAAVVLLAATLAIYTWTFGRRGTGTG